MIEQRTIPWAFRHFKVDEAMLQRVMQRLMGKGADYGDLFFEHGEVFTMQVIDGEVTNSFQSIDYGVGLRAVVNGKTGYAYCETTDEKSLLSAADSAAVIANMSKDFAPINLTEVKTNNYYRIDSAINDIQPLVYKQLLEEASQFAHSLSPYVEKVSASIGRYHNDVLIVNSLGDIAVDARPLTHIAISCVINKEGKRESNVVSRSFRSLGEELVNSITVRELTQKAVDNTLALYSAKQPKGGEMPVVMAAGSSGILLHEAIGHAFEADFNRKGTSIFSDKMGKKICSEEITIFDSGTLPYYRGSLNIDDEAVPGQHTVIVDHGVLSSYLHDRISAQHYGVKPTGNGRRESFRSIPVPRMRNTGMEAGTVAEAELIKDIKHGVYLAEFANGQVNIGAGDFTFYAKYGYMIEDGKLTQPIKDVNVIGNGPQALADITMVGDNSIMSDGTWTCGKAGQSVPVSCGMPSVVVSKLMVG